jgi:hypothetical protein
MYYVVGFEVLTAVVMKFAIFWDIALCSLYMSWLGYLPSLVSCSLIFDPEDGGDTFLRNVGSYMDYTALYPRRWQISCIILLLMYFYMHLKEIQDHFQIFIFTLRYFVCVYICMNSCLCIPLNLLVFHPWKFIWWLCVNCSMWLHRVRISFNAELPHSMLLFD